MESTSFVKLVYNEMLQDPAKQKWIEYVKTLLCSSGFSGAWRFEFIEGAI